MMLHENVISAVEMEQMQPISRTYQYRKVMKPMLERKRRARINRCLDELKELMVAALQSEGENVNKLEKADILELTVRHLHKLKRHQRLASNPITNMDRFRAGFTHCATEVSRCLSSIPGVDIQLGTKLMTHLGHRLNEFDKMSPLTVQVPQQQYTPPGTPERFPASPEATTVVNGTYYVMPLTPASSTSSRYGGSTSPSTSSSPSTSLEATGLLKVAEIPERKPWRPW